VLVLANFGAWEDLRVDGVPVGRLLGAGGGGRPAPGDEHAPAASPGDAPGSEGRPPAGSCIAVVATDAPLGTAQLERVARRAGLGLARTGSVAHHGSGEIFLAFAAGGAPDGTDDARSPGRPGTAADRPGTVPDRDLDPIFAATVDAAEEAVLNALWAAEDTSGRDGRSVRGLPHDDVVDLLTTHRRLDR
jgi:D-aminopeptidase